MTSRLLRNLPSIDLAIVLDAFVAVNLAFLALDIYVAHSMNEFAHATEWIPFAYSLLAPPALALSWWIGGRPRTAERTQGARARAGRRIGLLVGFAAVGVGVAGMLLHLQSRFFQDQTIENLVYTAPFAAPLAYAGLGLLAVMNRTVPSRSAEWGRWVVLMAMGGFLGNFVLSLADHAQNGFFDRREWIPVISAALAVGFLTTAVFVWRDRAVRVVCAWVMLLQIVVGVIGFLLHARANWLHGVSESVWENFVFGAPVFAPLLFPNLAALAALGLWAVARAAAEDSATSTAAEPALG